MFDNLHVDIRTLFDPNTALGAVVAAVILFFLALIASWILGRIIKKWEDKLRPVFRGMDETAWRFVLHLKTLVVFLVAFGVFSSVVPSLRTFLGTLVAGAGITAVVIGFAAKSTLANLVSGVALAVYRPIHLGDIVTIEDYYGTIEDITLRHTILLTWDQRRVVIPNEKLDSMTLVNYSLRDQRIMQPIEIGVSYDTDIDLARRLMLDEAARCPHRLPDHLAPRKPWVRVIDLADFSIVLRLYIWTPDMNEAWQARFWILEHVKKRFDAEGVEIPFPYRTVVFKKDLPAPPRMPADLEREDECSLDSGPESAACLEQVPEPAPPVETGTRKSRGLAGKFSGFWSKIRGGRE